MLYLHGSNRRGTDNQSQIADLYENIKGLPDNWQFIVVFPQCRENTFWAGPMMEQSLAALDQTVKEFGGNEDRLFIAGYSMGGFGVWQSAITHPDKFAALVSVAGGVEPVGEVSDEDKALLSSQVTAAASAPDTQRAYGEALRSLPVWVVHGSKDESVPVTESRKLVEALKAAGNADVNYIELEGVGHGSVMQAFSDPKLFEWLSKKKLIVNK
jgi:predicted peptidase